MHRSLASLAGLACALGLGACGHRHTFVDGGGGTDAANGAADGPLADAGGGGDGGGRDAMTMDGGGRDAAAMDGGGHDAAPPDARPPDARPPDAGGALTGGPCLSGAAGQTAYRIRWADGGGTAYPVYEVDGLPDTSRDKAGAYGYQIGFTPAFVDPYLGDGGLQLDDSDFVDLEISTAGLSGIDSATLSIYGRSYNVTTSGSFSWQTFDGSGAAPTNLVSNVAPYQWYSADMTTEISPGDSGVLIRIYAGPSSDSLVVNRVELCMQAR
jgi:hypothetical protein